MLTFQDVLLCMDSINTWMENIKTFAGQEGLQGSVPSNMGECVTGCTDANATNYNADAGCLGSTEYDVPGCMDDQHVTLMQMHK